MRVQCVKNKIGDMQGNAPLFDHLTNTLGYSANYQLNLTMGKSYVVYGVSIMSGYPWFFVADDSFTSYPMACVAPMVEITDNRLSKYWRFGQYFFEGRDSGPMSLITFHEWACDYTFYERLLDGEPKEKALFKRHKELMDLEFESPPV